MSSTSPINTPSPDDTTPRRRSRRNVTAVRLATEELRVRVNLRLPADAALKLRLHALARGKPERDIVADLIMTHLREYRMQKYGSDESEKGTRPRAENTAAA